MRPLRLRLLQWLGVDRIAEELLRATAQLQQVRREQDRLRQALERLERAEAPPPPPADRHLGSG